MATLTNDYLWNQYVQEFSRRNILISEDFIQERMLYRKSYRVIKGQVFSSDHYSMNYDEYFTQCERYKDLID